MYRMIFCLFYSCSKAWSHLLYVSSEGCYLSWLPRDLDLDEEDPSLMSCKFLFVANCDFFYWNYSFVTGLKDPDDCFDILFELADVEWDLWRFELSNLFIELQDLCFAREIPENEPSEVLLDSLWSFFRRLCAVYDTELFNVCPLVTGFKSRVCSVLSGYV